MSLLSVSPHILPFVSQRKAASRISLKKLADFKLPLTKRFPKSQFEKLLFYVRFGYPQKGPRKRMFSGPFSMGFFERLFPSNIESITGGLLSKHCS